MKDINELFTKKVVEKGMDEKLNSRELALKFQIMQICIVKCNLIVAFNALLLFWMDVGTYIGYRVFILFAFKWYLFIIIPIEFKILSYRKIHI